MRSWTPQRSSPSTGSSGRSASPRLSAFGINELELPPGAEGPEHDHAKDGQEEVYVIVRGSGTIRVDGTETELRPGVYVFLSPDARRQMVAGGEGLAWVGVGCRPGAFAPQQEPLPPAGRGRPIPHPRAPVGRTRLARRRHPGRRRLPVARHPEWTTQRPGCTGEVAVKAVARHLPHLFHREPAGAGRRGCRI